MNNQSLIKKEYKGVSLFLRKGTTDEMVFNEVIVRHSYEKKSFQILSNEVWLDLGANIGTFSLFASSKGARIIAYEPELSNYNLLVENTRHKAIQCIQKAVVGNNMKAMTLSLGKDVNNHWRHSLYKNKKGSSIAVPCIHFKDILTDEIQGIKMDIEGGEIEIFDTIEEWKNVKKLVFEYHFDIQPNIFRFLQQMKKLKKHFSVVDYGKTPVGVAEYKFFPAARTVFCIK